MLSRLLVPLGLDLIDDENLVLLVLAVLPLGVQPLGLLLEFTHLRGLLGSREIQGGLGTGGLQGVLVHDLLLVVLGGLLRLTELRLGSILLFGHRGVTETRPGDGTALSGVAEVDLVTLVPRLNRRHSESDFVLVRQTFRGVTLTDGVDSLNLKPIVNFVLVIIPRICAITDLLLLVNIVTKFEVISVPILHLVKQPLILFFVIVEALVLVGINKFINLRLQLFKRLSATNHIADVILNHFPDVNIFGVVRLLDLDLVLRDEGRDLVLG